MTDAEDPMQNAEIDLLANVSGQFSPDDWRAILSEARGRLERHRAEGASPSAAWAEVMRAFTRESYFGFQPNYRPERAPKVQKSKRKNFGLRFAILVITSMTVTKIAVVWLGQVYSRSDEPADKYRFFAVLALVALNFGYFLWSMRDWSDT